MASFSAWRSRISPPANGAGPLLFTTSALAFLAFLNATVLNVAIPDVVSGLDGDVELASWTVTAYVTALAAGLIAGGRLADSVGRRGVLAVGTGLFAVASIAGALAADTAALVAARGVQGAAAAMITPASFGLLLEATPADRRARAIGAWSSAAATSAFVGPPLGGALVDLAGWRAPLALSAAAALVLIGFVLSLPRSPRPSADVPALRGALLGGVAVALLALATAQADEWGITDPRTLVGLVGGAVGLGVGVLGAAGVNWRVVDPGLLRRRRFAAANGLSIVFGFAAFSWLLAAPLFVSAVWNWDALTAALSVLPGAVAAALAASGAGRLSGRGRAWAIVGGSVVLGATALVLVGALDRSPRFLAVWLPAGILTGLSMGGVLASLSAVVATSVPQRQFAQAAGINMTARQLGGALGVAAVAALLAGGGAEPAAFAAVWVMIGVASAITAAGGVVLLRPGKPDDHVAGERRQPLANYSSVRLEA